MSIVAAAIAPHGGIVVAELCEESELGLAEKTRGGMEELGARFEAAKPATVIVLTPHNLHVDGHLSVVTARQTAGSVREDNGRTIELELEGDRALALEVLGAIRAAGVPALGITFGGNDPDFKDGQVMPTGWGEVIPMWYLGGRFASKPRIVVVSASRDLSPEDHVAAGRAIGATAEHSRQQVAIVASADHAHAHAESGPYGFDPAAHEYDELVTRLVRENRLGDLLFVDPELVDRAKADSWWQLLMLYGALENHRQPLQLLSYEAPTYFGMLCAVASDVP